VCTVSTEYFPQLPFECITYLLTTEYFPSLSTLQRPPELPFKQGDHVPGVCRREQQQQVSCKMWNVESHLTTHTISDTYLELVKLSHCPMPTETMWNFGCCWSFLKALYFRSTQSSDWKVQCYGKMNTLETLMFHVVVGSLSLVL
jgi:hypothetical protein